MSSSCPYCGAALKLKFCVVCGRQSKLNKMGNIRSTARNTDTTARLEDPFAEEDEDVQKSLRFRKNIRSIIEVAFGTLIACALIFCATREALNFCSSNSINNIVLPWMKNHHFTFPQDWPSNLGLSKPQDGKAHKTRQNTKRRRLGSSH